MTKKQKEEYKDKQIDLVNKATEHEQKVTNIERNIEIVKESEEEYQKESKALDESRNFNDLAESTA